MAVRVLYLAQSAFAAPAPGPRVIAVGTLAARARARRGRPGAADLADPRSAALMALIVADLGVAPELPLHLPWPRTRARVPSPRRWSPTTPCSPADLAPTAGLSRRTLERCFSSEMGSAQPGWQRRARVTAALVLLAEELEDQTALDVGYATPSAFTAAFRRELGPRLARTSRRRRRGETGLSRLLHRPPDDLAVDGHVEVADAVGASSASITALCTAGVEPIVPDSPMPSSRPAGSPASASASRPSRTWAARSRQGNA